MSSPKETCSPHGWTLDKLAEHFESRLAWLEKYTTDLSEQREITTKERFASSREAVAAALVAAKEAVTAAMAASDKAIAKTEAAADKRAEQSNEIRAAMIDQQTQLANKGETNLRFAALEKRLEEYMASAGKHLEVLDALAERSTGRSAGIGATTGTIVTLLGMTGGVITLIFSGLMLYFVSRGP